MPEKEEKRTGKTGRKLEKALRCKGNERGRKNSQGKSKKMLTFQKAVLYYCLLYTSFWAQNREKQSGSVYRFAFLSPVARDRETKLYLILFS